MTSHSLKPLAAMLLIAVASISAQGQFRILRPEKAAAPAVRPVALTQASVKVKEHNDQQKKRNKVRRKVQRIGEAHRLPPIEFTAASTQGTSLESRLNPDLYKGPKPESPVPAITAAGNRAIKVGDKEVAIPECLTVFEQDADFFTAGMGNMLEINSWMFDSSYKLSTPQAYSKYIEKLYGGLEQNETQGVRTILSGFDSKTSRNYYITLLKDGERLYVTRLLYSSAVARPVRERVIPSLHP